MSRIQKKVAPTIIEPESFEEEENFTPEYKPEHPALAAYNTSTKVTKPDHLDNYVEVDPFAKKETEEKKVE
jgi:hypothetical protein|tara:strand:- start:193 stop:405 length:213 start_codon:yes stop_codon:yes gene_type:complete